MEQAGWVVFFWSFASVPLVLIDTIIVSPPDPPRKVSLFPSMGGGLIFPAVQTIGMMLT